MEHKVQTYISEITPGKMLGIWAREEDKANELLGDKLALGISNELVEKGTINVKGWIVFLDYDNRKLDFVKKKCKMLQKQWSLGNAYIFSTGIDKWHVWFLDVVERLSTVWRILEKSGCDKKYLKMGRRRKSLNIRLSSKKGLFIAYAETVYSAGKRKLAGTHFQIIREKHDALFEDMKEKGQVSKLGNIIFGYGIRPVVYVLEQQETALDEMKILKERGFTLGKDIHGNRLRSRV